jgi:hypothetical protein
LSIAFTKHSLAGSINKLKKMTGISIGVKNSSYQKPWIKLDSIPIEKSTISGTFIKFVGKICFPKMSNGLRKL